MFTCIQGMLNIVCGILEVTYGNLTAIKREKEFQSDEIKPIMPTRCKYQIISATSSPWRSSYYVIVEPQSSAILAYITTIEVGNDQRMHKIFPCPSCHPPMQIFPLMLRLKHPKQTVHKGNISGFYVYLDIGFNSSWHLEPSSEDSNWSFPFGDILLEIEPKNWKSLRTW